MKLEGEGETQNDLSPIWATKKHSTEITNTQRQPEALQVFNKKLIRVLGRGDTMQHGGEKLTL